MVSRIIIRCYCGREWELMRERDIACSRCGFVLRVKKKGEDLLLWGQRPLCRNSWKGGGKNKDLYRRS